MAVVGTKRILLKLKNISPRKVQNIRKNRKEKRYYIYGFLSAGISFFVAGVLARFDYSVPYAGKQ